MNIEVHQKPASRYVEIYVWEPRGNLDVFYAFDKGELIAQEREQNMVFMDEELIPTMRMPVNIYRPLLEALAKEAQKQGVATEREDHLKGKLDAMQNHLTDLQKMVMPMLTHLTTK